MSSITPLPHTLPELTELGLISYEEGQALPSAGIQNTTDFFQFFKKHNDFTSIPDLNEEGQQNLLRLAKAYVKTEQGELTKEDLYDPAVHKKDTPFVPVRIEWEKITGIKRAFLDAWFRRAIEDYFEPTAQLFLKDYLGGVTTAEEFYERAILHPIRPGEPSVRRSTHAPQLTRLIRVFFTYHQAVQLLDDPIELLRFHARVDLGVDPASEIYDTILKPKADGTVPFAAAVYRLTLASPYFTYPRRMQQINRMRYVRIFQDDPYTLGGLMHMGLNEARFKQAQEEAEELAVSGCRSFIAILTALGYGESYRSLKAWDNDSISKELVWRINRDEELHLPAAFYALLFNELYGTRFVKAPRLGMEWVKEEVVYVNEASATND
ncbi:MAG: hypothetical protein IT226_13990 [Flavobacteriales bacterium]|nr:hypothetical protein [Flavobacteriales bacterium]